MLSKRSSISLGGYLLKLLTLWDDYSSIKTIDEGTAPYLDMIAFILSTSIETIEDLLEQSANGICEENVYAYIGEIIVVFIVEKFIGVFYIYNLICYSTSNFFYF